MFLAKRKRDQETKAAPAQQSSSVFEDAYIDGKLQSSPCTSPEIPLSYIKSFCAELNTAADIDRHEALVYNEGRTPSAIRSSVKVALRSGVQDQHIMPFQVEDIPPPNRDSQTHMVLHALLSELQKHKKNQPKGPRNEPDDVPDIL